MPNDALSLANQIMPILEQAADSATKLAVIEICTVLVNRDTPASAPTAVISETVTDK